MRDCAWWRAHLEAVEGQRHIGELDAFLVRLIDGEVFELNHARTAYEGRALEDTVAHNLGFVNTPITFMRCPKSQTQPVNQALLRAHVLPVVCRSQDSLVSVVWPFPDSPAQICSSLAPLPSHGVMTLAMSCPHPVHCHERPNMRTVWLSSSHNKAATRASTNLMPAS